MSENNIKKIREYCKENIEENKKDKLKFSIQIILIVVGMIHIIFADYLKEKLTIITGITTINISLINLIRNIKKKEYKTLDTMKIPENIVALLLGIMTLFKGQNAISFIAIIWGITGLRKGVKGFNIALYNKVNNNNYTITEFNSYYISIKSLKVSMFVNNYDELKIRPSTSWRERGSEIFGEISF